MEFFLEILEAVLEGDDLFLHNPYIFQFLQSGNWGRPNYHLYKKIKTGTGASSLQNEERFYNRKSGAARQKKRSANDFSRYGAKPLGYADA